MKNLNASNNICPICGFRSSFIFKSKHNRNIFECRNINCGHFFTPPDSILQGVCARDDQIEKESDEFLEIYDERNVRLLEYFKTKIPKSSEKINLLDFGAGNAHISRTFKRILQDQATIYCLESNLLCNNLYSKYGLVQVEKVADLPNKKLDLIYMIEVIEHLINPLEILRSLREKLNEYGHFFLSTPCGNSSEWKTHAYDTPSHLHFFTEKSLNLALVKSGFEPIMFEYLPQMYPIQSKTPQQVLYSTAKNLLKRFSPIILYKPKIKHLVGLTKAR